ncbi:diguanylate cyclase [Pseudooceanicola sediminis]|nr:diguanylate cyclase [Pseudooceanicola sediminis]|tara:strand:- start:16351 stop:17433 length:1083 start_codon:yes stop_codon:yes gene_type:complete
MQSALLVVQGLGLMALLTIAFSVVHGQSWPRGLRHAVLGLCFGLGAILSMMQPIPVAPGMLVDTRNLFIGFAGAFIGPVGAIVALAAAAIARITIGGAGLGLGLISMTTVACVGTLWGLRRLRPPIMTLMHCVLMGVSFSITLVIGLIALRGEALQNFLPIIPFILMFNVGGSVVFGMLFERERRSARRERQLQNDAQLDPLTAAYNRRGLDRLYSDVMYMNENFGRGLLLIDLDHFKKINDTCGHAFGDEVLRASTKAIQSSVRGGDVVARIGGEEFVVLLPDVTQENARRIGERIRSAIRKAAGVDGVTITASVGASYWQHGGRSLDAALKAADGSMYEAKRQGRDRMVFPESDLHPR